MCYVLSPCVCVCVCVFVWLCVGPPKMGQAFVEKKNYIPPLIFHRPLRAFMVGWHVAGAFHFSTFPIAPSPFSTSLNRINSQFVLCRCRLQRGFCWSSAAPSPLPLFSTSYFSTKPSRKGVVKRLLGASRKGTVPGAVKYSSGVSSRVCTKDVRPPWSRQKRVFSWTN